MSEVSIGAEDPGSPDVSKLIGRLDTYLMSLYPPESNHLMSIESLRRPNVTFFVARVEGRAVGCCGVVNHNGEYAEGKRLFVLPGYRGLQIGRRLLATREAHAKAAGLKVIRSETGVSQHEAIRLFEQAGYHRRGPFGDYPNDPLSIFMEKELL